VREHGMGAILNGLAAHGGAVPFGATFLIFSDYMRPPIRLAAMMKLMCPRSIARNVLMQMACGEAHTS
jgi:transketolase